MSQWNVFLIFSVLLFFSCNSAPGKSENQAKADSSAANEYRKRTGLEAEPVIGKTDSLQLVYYDDPDGDSLRYSRFFTYVNTTDSVVINSLLHDLEQPFETVNEVKKCRSEGKIYLLGRQESLKTIYFSTRGDSCTYLYFIKDGAFFYFPLSENFKSILATHRDKALKP